MMWWKLPSWGRRELELEKLELELELELAM
jgi:hypothetical protein